MGKKDKIDGVVADYLAIMGSRTSLEIVNRIVDLSREDLDLADCHDLVINNFNEFCRRTGTLFKPELQIRCVCTTDKNALECRFTVALLNDFSYQETGQDILHLLLKMVNSNLTNQDKHASSSPFPSEFSKNCLALTFYSHKNLTQAERKELSSLLTSIGRAVGNIMQTTLTPVYQGPDFAEIKAFLKDNKTESETKSLHQEPYLHEYSPFPYKIYSLDFIRYPGKVLINDKIYHVFLPGDLLSKIRNMVIEFTGKELKLRRLSKSYSKNSTYQVIPNHQESSDEISSFDKILVLDKYTLKSIRFLKERPSMIYFKSLQYYVYFPSFLVVDIEVFIKKSLGTRITLKENNVMHEGRRCHRLVL